MKVLILIVAFVAFGVVCLEGASFKVGDPEEAILIRTPRMRINLDSLSLIKRLRDPMKREDDDRETPVNRLKRLWYYDLLSRLGYPLD